MLLPVTGTVLGVVGTALTYILVPFFVAYVLADRAKPAAAWQRAVPSEWHPDVDAVTGMIGRIRSAYVRGEAITIAVMSVLTFLAVMLMGVVVNPEFEQYAAFLALMAAFAELIPALGPSSCSSPG